MGMVKPASHGSGRDSRVAVLTVVGWAYGTVESPDRTACGKFLPKTVSPSDGAFLQRVTEQHAFITH